MKNWLKILLILLLTAAVYRDSFTSRFFQDDRIAMDLALSGNWLATVPVVLHYRPVAFQLFYGIGLWLFGLNPLGYHLLEFLAFGVTVFLVFSLANSFLKNKTKALATSFFYALNVSLFSNFFWIATSYFSLGALFYFLTVYLYLKRGFLAAMLTILAVITALLTNELALTLPLIWFLVSWYQKLWPKRLLAGVMACFAYLVLKVFVIGLPRVTDYSFEISAKVFANIRWYLLRALNLPEGIRAGSNPTIIILFSIFLILLGISTWRYLSRKPIKKGLVFFAAGWFFVAAIPFFFLPNHMSSYYLTMAMFGPAMIFAEVLANKRLLLLTLAVYLLLTVTSLDFLSQSHWTILKNTGPIGKF